MSVTYSIKIHFSCEIEDLSKLIFASVCVILRSRLSHICRGLLYAWCQAIVRVVGKEQAFGGGGVNESYVMDGEKDNDVISIA